MKLVSNKKSIVEAVEESSYPTIDKLGDFEEKSVGTADVVYAQAVKDMKNNREKVKKTLEDSESFKAAEEMVKEMPKPDMGSKIKNAYTEKYTLDESLFEDYITEITAYGYESKKEKEGRLNKYDTLLNKLARAGIKEMEDVGNSKLILHGNVGIITPSDKVEFDGVAIRIPKEDEDNFNKAMDIVNEVGFDRVVVKEREGNKNILVEIDDDMYESKKVGGGQSLKESSTNDVEYKGYVISKISDFWKKARVAGKSANYTLGRIDKYGNYDGSGQEFETIEDAKKLIDRWDSMKNEPLKESAEDEYTIWYVKHDDKVDTLELSPEEKPVNIRDFLDDMIRGGFNTFELYSGMTNAGPMGLIAKVENEEVIEVNEELAESCKSKSNKKTLKEAINYEAVLDYWKDVVAEEIRNNPSLADSSLNSLDEKRFNEVCENIASDVMNDDELWDTVSETVEYYATMSKYEYNESCKSKEQIKEDVSDDTIVDDAIIVYGTSGQEIDRHIEIDDFYGYSDEEIVEEVIDKHGNDVVIKRVSYDKQNIPVNYEVLYDVEDIEESYKSKKNTSLKEDKEQEEITLDRKDSDFHKRYFELKKKGYKTVWTGEGKIKLKYTGEPEEERKEFFNEGKSIKDDIEFVMNRYVDGDGFEVKGKGKNYNVTYNGKTVKVKFDTDWDEYVYAIDGKGPYSHSSYEYIRRDIEEYIHRHLEEDTQSKWVKGPRGEFKLSDKSKEELKKDGYGFHHSFDDKGKTYNVMTKDNSAVAVLDESKSLKEAYSDMASAVTKDGKKVMASGTTSHTRTYNYEHVDFRFDGRSGKGKYRYMNRPWQRFDFASALKEAMVDAGIDSTFASNIIEKSHNLESAIDMFAEMYGSDNKTEVNESVYDTDLSSSKYNEEVWEGWTIKDIIDEMSGEFNMIMSGKAMKKPFKNSGELKAWLKDTYPLNNVKDSNALGVVLRYFNQIIKDKYNGYGVTESAKIYKSKVLKEDAKIYIDIGDYKPWSGAVETWDKILEANKLEEFDSLIEEMYPEGLSETELNDILWFESEWVYDMLSMSETEEETEEEEEVEETESEEE